MISPNINFNSSILEGNKAEVHQRYLALASQNLEDYNSRLNLKITLNYNDAEFEFELADDYTSEGAKITNNINWYKWHSIQKDFEKGFKAQYIDTIYNEYDKILQLFRFSNFMRLSLASNISGFKSDRNAFIAEFENYCPIGFFSNESEAEIKTKLNQFCDNLRAEYTA